MKFIANLVLARKIAFGYIIIMVVATLSGLIVFYNLQRLKTIDSEISESNTKMIIKLKDYSFLVNESVKLANAWIYQPEKASKERLEAIQNKELLSSKEDILVLTSGLDQDSLKLLIDDLFVASLKLSGSEKSIMTTLASDESYSDDVAIDKAISTYDNDVNPTFADFGKKYALLLTALNNRQHQLTEVKASSHSFMSVSMVVVMITVVIVGFVATQLINKFVSKPINHLQKVIDLSSKGELVEVKKETRTDEIGKINNSIGELVKNLKEKTTFATAIGKGDYDKDLVLHSEADVLGKALIEMRNSLKYAQVEDKKRNWFNTGLANISEVLRKYQSDHEHLYDEVIRFVVKYLGANQGSFFELEHDGDAEFLTLKACYAYDRKKFLEKQLAVGEGLVGQSILEKSHIFLTKIPQNYTYITSGVGEATPSCVLIFPLIVNEKAYGVIEIASFKVLEKHEIDFALKIGESIASTVSAVKVNGMTQKLLEQARIKEEELRSQEEEMRQNMEELHATQEQLRRQELELVERHKAELEELRSFYEKKIASQMAA